MNLRRNTLYNFLGGLISVVGALITVPIYVKLIGPARYGVLAIAWILLGYFGLFDLGLGRATSFKIAAQRDSPASDRADTFWAAVLVNLTMGLVGGALLWAAAQTFFAHFFKVSEALRPEIVAAVPFLAASVPIATLSGVLTGAMQGREKFLAINVVSVTSTLLFQILPLGIVFLLGPNISQILAAALLARLVSLVVVAGLCYLEIVKGHPARLVGGQIPELLKYGGWVTVASLLTPILTMLDRFAIGATLGAVSVAAYTIPYQPAKQIQMLPAALTSALFPKISAASPEGRDEYARNATLILAAAVSLPVLGGIFLAGPGLILWVGHDLGVKAAVVGRLLLIGFWLNAFAMVAHTQLQASGRPDLVTKMQIAEIPPYLAFLFVGLTVWGIAGAAAAFVFRCLIDYLLLSWANRRSFPGIGVLTANLALLSLAAWLSSLWSISDWRWWAGAVALGLPALALGWLSLPAALKQECLRLFRPLRGLFA